MLVHSLEHGLVVVYYDRLSADALATLEDWSGLYGGPFSGIVVTRQPGLGDRLLLTPGVNLCPSMISTPTRRRCSSTPIAAAARKIRFAKL